MGKESIAAASATYRKVVNEIAEVLDKEPEHSRYPSADFEAALESIPAAMREKALEWYERGIRRGLSRATDLMADKTIYLKNDVVYAPKTIKIKVRIKMSGDKWTVREFRIHTKDIGFD
ncbi:hypothetical protein AO721_10755 [Aeromonas veronii]|uniref:hypothetical protein n=1 Tax=Aeromonas veronii TaxID=654 RepID=UPI00071848A2|nr:hypothetical protein [Aeromonas veronii]KRV69374.1 hypothetical protein AO728_11985 [Aeromonas veronii]KRV73317.1 hypothetical protein AO719_07930 [Aeromonas veronii]KRV83414.1 hypothetical protein AO721_10755 [Aeromonas veronii]KRV83560.1 hypothetical protein AO739_09595 [Aeromonas veronii]